VISAQRLYWLAQFIGWISYGGLLLFFTFITRPGLFNIALVTNVGVFVTWAIICTHLMRVFYLRKNWLVFRLYSVIPRLLLSSIFIGLMLVLGNRVFAIADDVLAEREVVWSSSRIIINWISNTIIVLIWNAIYFGYAFFKKYYYQEINNLTIEASYKEVELKNLRNQLNPHFLFNSLNSIKALIQIDPAKAKESLTLLSNLLRGSLLMENEGMISLSKELELCKNYLMLEKIRFEERLEVSWDIQVNTDSIQVPPFVLQLMVENSVKHGISTLMNGGEIIITIKNTDEGFLIQVKNSGRIDKKEQSFGIGIENTKRRLDLQYQNRASMLMYEEENMVVAQILLKN
jgi:two-component system LytT family sensor kinase